MHVGFWMRTGFSWFRIVTSGGSFGHGNATFVPIHGSNFFNKLSDVHVLKDLLRYII